MVKIYQRETKLYEFSRDTNREELKIKKGQSNDGDMVKYELRVEIQMHELRVQVHELRVRIHESRVRISTSYEFESPSSRIIKSLNQ